MNKFFEKLKSEMEAPESYNYTFKEKFCLDDLEHANANNQYTEVCIVRWLRLFKQLEGYKVISVDLTNALDRNINPVGSIATLEIRVEQ